jgi:hypothetical protein
MENEMEKFYIECITNILIGLEIQQIEKFMERLTPQNCLKLGTAYSNAVRERLGVTLNGK